ncbi:MAG: hypothetical protein NVS9B9_21480 [Ktedonobacteraceae bacterium]
MVNGALTILADRTEEAEYLLGQKGTDIPRETILVPAKQALGTPLLFSRWRNRCGQACYPRPNILRAVKEGLLHVETYTDRALFFQRPG